MNGLMTFTSNNALSLTGMTFGFATASVAATVITDSKTKGVGTAAALTAAVGLSVFTLSRASGFPSDRALLHTVKILGVAGVITGAAIVGVGGAIFFVVKNLGW